MVTKLRIPCSISLPHSSEMLVFMDENECVSLQFQFSGGKDGFSFRCLRHCFDRLHRSSSHRC